MGTAFAGFAAVWLGMGVITAVWLYVSELRAPYSSPGNGFPTALALLGFVAWPVVVSAVGLTRAAWCAKWTERVLAKRLRE